MPTKKPRITISLDPEIYETIKALADVQERPASAVISELVTEVEPELKKVLALLLEAKRAPYETLQRIALEISSAGEFFGGLTDHSSDLTELLKSASVPPYSNRGVTTQTAPPPLRVVHAPHRKESLTDEK